VPQPVAEAASFGTESAGWQHPRGRSCQLAIASPKLPASVRQLASWQLAPRDNILHNFPGFFPVCVLFSRLEWMTAYWVGIVSPDPGICKMQAP